MLPVQFMLAVYGGYFGGAVGIMMMAVWGLLSSASAKVLNLPKVLLVGAMNGVAVICFIVAGKVWWPENLAMLVAAAVGGYAGVRLARRLSPAVVRAVIVVVSFASTVAFFLRLSDPDQQARDGEKPMHSAPARPAFLVLAALFAAVPALAQAPNVRRLHGVIDSATAQTLMLTTDGGSKTQVGVTAKTPVVLVARARFSDIKPGSFVGTAAVPGPGGTLRALEVHVFAEDMRGVGEGHRPWDEPQSTMTNGTVGEVAGTDGRTLHVTYKGGEQTVKVAADTPVVSMQRGSPDMLTPGAHVSVSAVATEGGGWQARFVAVGKDGFEPPV